MKEDMDEVMNVSGIHMVLSFQETPHGWRGKARIKASGAAEATVGGFESKVAARHELLTLAEHEIMRLRERSAPVEADSGLGGVSMHAETRSPR